MAVRRVSLVDQVRQGLLDDLLAGTLEPGEKLPNEDKLAERFAVSRATVREAVLGLLEAGYLIRRHGSGTWKRICGLTRSPAASLRIAATATPATTTTSARACTASPTTPSVP